MQITQRPSVPITSNGMELFHYPTPSLPYNILFADIAKYNPASVPWHWHKENELAVIYSGSVTVYFTNKRIHLQEGEGLFINSNVLHSMQIAEGGHCEILTIIFEPSLFLGGLGNAMHQKYAFPILNCTSLDSLHLTPNVAWQEDSILRMKNVYDSYVKEKMGYELILCEQLLHIWQELFINSMPLINSRTHMVSEKEERLKGMLDYIHSNYMHSITLEQIASSVNISPRECTRCFQSCIVTSPIAYLTRYRLAIGTELLAYTGDSITSIATKVGFNSPSHFTKMFRLKYSCTPFEYRNTKQLQNSSSRR
ncbi:MAG TPA: AraC family transcriptional regulator [Lachnospiraceae bacterium]|nr:AraC family transcriptional regulator [Lachnospiraceae bacterium]